jgi:hypothetical protein
MKFSYLTVTALIPLLCACESQKTETVATGVNRDSIAAPEQQTTQLATRSRALTKYGTSSGIIEYQNHWLGRKQTFYFDRYGAREAMYTHAGARDVPFDVGIYTGGAKVNYNRKEKEGILAYRPNLSGPLLGSIPDLRTVESSPLESDTIAGKVAAGVRFLNGSETRVWMWKGLPLRLMEIRPNGDTVLLEALSVSEGVAIPESRFRVPKDVRLSRDR